MQWGALTCMSCYGPAFFDFFFVSGVIVLVQVADRTEQRTFEQRPSIYHTSAYKCSRPLERARVGAQLRGLAQAVDERGMFRRAAAAAALADAAAALDGSARSGPAAASSTPAGAGAAQSGPAPALDSHMLDGAVTATSVTRAGAPAAEAVASTSAQHGGAEGVKVANGFANGADDARGPAAERSSAVAWAGAVDGRLPGSGVGEGEGLTSATLATAPSASSGDEGELPATQPDDADPGPLSGSGLAVGPTTTSIDTPSCSPEDTPPPAPPLGDGVGLSLASGGGETSLVGLGSGDGARQQCGGKCFNGSEDVNGSGTPGAPVRRPLPESEAEAAERVKAALRAADARVGRLHAALPANALLLVLGCQGDTFEVRLLQVRGRVKKKSKKWTCHNL